VALGDLYIGAVRCGMDPKLYFDDAAEISSGVSNIERTSMRDFSASKDQYTSGRPSPPS
jgi:hypothetical protein